MELIEMLIKLMQLFQIYEDINECFEYRQNENTVKQITET